MKPLLFLLPVLLFAPAAAAQLSAYDKLVTDFLKAKEYEDEAGMDKALRSAPKEAVLYFQRTCLDRRNGNPGSETLLEALSCSWKRVFEKATVLDEIRAWVDSRDNDSLRRYYAARDEVDRCYDALQDGALNKLRPPYEALGESATRAAELMEETGHLLEAAEAWEIVLVVYTNIPDPRPIERSNAVHAAERFVELRDSWGWTADKMYERNSAWLRSERERLRDAEALAKSRANETDGETLLMPVEDEVHDLEFQMLEALELDYCARGGPVPALWWDVQLPKDASCAKMEWFTCKPLFLMRMGATHFGVSCHPVDPSETQEVDVSTRPEPSLFYLGEGSTHPYAMWFYVGSDRERVYHAELNLAPTDELAVVFYRSASSWTTRIGDETVTFYDDSCDGRLFQKDPYRMGLVLYTLGDPREGTRAPVLDSMRVGNGPRIPYSEFVKIGGSWFHMRGREGDTKVGLRPVNPDFFKTGRVKLAWSGNRRTRPTVLVIRGRGILSAAFFQVAPDEEVEVPIGEYEVCFGRVVSGRGARVQCANIYRGRSEPFRVEEDRTFELEMGAPFRIDFVRGGDESHVEIEATGITLYDKCGAVYADLHNAVVVPEVQAARDDSGRGARSFAKFVIMDDPEFVDEAASRWPRLGRNVAMFPAPMGARLGDTNLRERLPFRGAKVGLIVRRHPLFGEIESGFK